jgi:hypothetical protein
MEFRVWIGLWTTLMVVLLVAFNLSFLVKYITRFTEVSFFLNQIKMKKNSTLLIFKGLFCHPCCNYFYNRRYQKHTQAKRATLSSFRPKIVHEYIGIRPGNHHYFIIKFR